jgi:HD-GYP domain-containing protein (c-di-GMP phosphodiesterase class II)
MPDQDLASLKLAARVAQVTSEFYQLSYARVDPDLSVVQVSPNFSSVLGRLDIPETGIPLTEAFVEFVGVEETLKSILRGGLPSFKIDRVNRLQPDGFVRYLTFQVVPFDAKRSEAGLLVIIEDVTHFGLIEHNLLQSRNELRLAQDALARTNAELDERVERRTAELAEAKKQIEKQLFRLQSLRVNDLAILGTTDLRVALKTIAEQTKKQLHVDLISIFLLNSHSLILESAVVVGAQSVELHTAHMRLGETLIGRAALERRVLSFPDLTTAALQTDKWVQAESLQACYVIPLIAKGKVVGILFLGHRSILEPDQEWLDFLETLAGQTAMAIESIKAFEDLQRSNYELALAYNRTIQGWSHALDLRDRETKDHTSRVTAMTVALARMMGMTDSEILHVERGALLHDIGKMGIPDAILLKEDYLTEEEWKIMRQHPTYAHQMLFPIEYLRPALDIPYCHHERWDGTGYPRGLRGDEIPLAARLFTVVDVWDALLSDRPYRKGWQEDKVREYIQSQSGSHFDPQVVELFLSVVDEVSHAVSM